MITERIHVQERIPRFFNPEDLPEQRLPALPGHGADILPFHSVPADDSHSETLFRAPVADLFFGPPNADPPPGLLTAGKRFPTVRHHDLVGRRDPARRPDIRSHLDFVGHLLHGRIAPDLPTEMRLPGVDAQRLDESLATEVIHAEIRRAGAEKGGTRRQKPFPHFFTLT